MSAWEPGSRKGCPSELLDSSREAATEYSPGRKPGVKVRSEQAPEGKKKGSHALNSALH